MTDDLRDAEAAPLATGDLDGAARLNADCWLGLEAEETARSAVFQR